MVPASTREDHLGGEEAAHIVCLTRTLDHLEEALENPFWELGYLPPQPSDSPKS